MKNLFLSLIVFSVTGLSMAGLSQGKSSDENRINHQTVEQNHQMVEQNQVDRGSFVVVGRDINDPECDHFGIQIAIDSGATEIRIATEIYAESLVIEDQSVELLGGYGTCTEAANMTGFNPSQIAVINSENGSSNKPGVTIISNVSRKRVDLRNLLITDGTGVGFTPGGGISTFGADLDLRLRNIELANNVGILGGGLSVLGGNTQVDANNLLVRNNTAETGGGIFCSGSQVSVLLTDSNGASRSGIRFNEATNGHGGGISMQSGCQLLTYTGTAVSSASDLRGISHNLASNGNGGGLALDSGSKAYLVGFEDCFNGMCEGNSDHPININANQAESNNTGLGVGGGIYAIDAGTFVQAFSTNLSSNVSQRAGGGAYIGSNAGFTMQKVPLPCWSSQLCNHIDSNRAGTSGGGLLVTASSTTSVTHANIRNNRANDGAAVFVGLGLTNNPATITNAIISGNGDNGSGQFQDNNAIYTASDLDIRFSTITDNQVQNQTIFQSSSTNANEVNLFASIVHSPGLDVYGSQGGGSTFAVNCLLANEDNSFSGNNVLVGNPDFIDRFNGDYHIGGSSPAIDMCTTTVTASDQANGGVIIFSDIDDEIRGFDDPTVINIDGPFDAGADETYINDIIFADGFE